MLAEDIADVLSTGGMGTVASTIFIGPLRDNVDTGVAVIETGGIFPVHAFSSGPATTIGAGVAVVERPRVQVFSRAPDYATARAQAQNAFNLLDGMQDRTVNSVKYLYVEAVQSPVDLGRDKNDRQRFSVNFDVTKNVSTSTTT